MQNLLQAVKRRDRNLLHAEMAIGAHSAAYCHLANIDYRTGSHASDGHDGLVRR